MTTTFYFGRILIRANRQNTSFILELNVEVSDEGDNLIIQCSVPKSRWSKTRGAAVVQWLSHRILYKRFWVRILLVTGLFLVQASYSWAVHCSGCSTVVEYTSHSHVTAGSNLALCWASFLLLAPQQKSIDNSTAVDSMPSSKEGVGSNPAK